MTQTGEPPLLLSTFLNQNYTSIKSSVASKSMGSIDSKIITDGPRSSPMPCEVESSYFETELEPCDKFPSLGKCLNSPQSKSQKCKAWLVDSAIQNAGVKKFSSPEKNSDLKRKSPNRSPLQKNLTLVHGNSPKSKSSPATLNALESSPSQNLRQRVKKDISRSTYRKSKLVKGIRFHDSENNEVRRNLRLRKRKQPEKEVDSDSDSEISFKPKRRKINNNIAYKMVPLKTKGRKDRKEIKGLRRSIAEKRASKRNENQTKLNNELKQLDSLSEWRKPSRIQRKRKRESDSPRSSPRTKADKAITSSFWEENFENKKVKRDLRKRSDSPLKRKFSENMIERKRRKMKSGKIIRMHNMSENENVVATKHRDTTSKKVNSPIATRTSPRTKLDQKLCQEDSPSQQKSTLNSSLTGTSASSPLSYRLTASPKLNGLPAVLSLNTLSGIPHKIQGSSFSSVRPGFGATAVSGFESLPTTPTPSTSETGFFQSSPRPNTLSIDHNSDSSPSQVVNTNTSSQSALDNLLPKSGSNSCGKQTEKTHFTKLKTKMTLAETVDMLRQSPNLNGVSVLKNNSFHKKTLTPSDDHSSRNSSRSVTPNVTPIKSEVLTPSCTPCSTPKKSPSCSPAPSLDHVPVGRLKGDQKHLFRLHQDVLAQWHDGLYYLGSILKIEENNRRCLLRYEDNSKYWSLFKDIHRGAKDGEMICCVCLGENSEKPNEIVLCDNCGQGYHQNCHIPVVGGSEILDPDDEWCCRKCIFALTIKAGGALKEGKYAEELKKMKLTFPYDLRTLTWDAQHKTNVEQYYCYCGGPGIWYQKMLQCCRCKQWFHEACIQFLEYPLLFADSFYIFVCTSCNFGHEYIKRLSIDWPDLVHITLFNLTMERNQKYYGLDEDIMTWIDDNWDLLQVKEYNELEYMERKKQVEEALNRNKKRFINGNEVRKRAVFWGLRVRVPPPRTHIKLPVDGLVDDEVMKKLKVKGRRSKVFVPVPCKSPVQMRHSPLQVKGAARHQVLQNYPLISEDEKQVKEAVAQSCIESQPPPVTGPLLERLIPPLRSYEGHNHPFKFEVEQQMERIENEQRTAIWRYCQLKDEAQLADNEDNTSVALDGPPVLVKEEPVEEVTDMSPPLSGITEASSQRDRGRKSKTPRLTQSTGLKRSKRLSSQKLPRNTPPNLEQNLPVTQEISVRKVKSARANYLCAFDKLGYGKGLYILGKRETEGKLDYMISWE